LKKISFLQKQLLFCLFAIPIFIGDFARAEKTKAELEGLYKSFQEQAIENVFVTYQGHEIYWVTLKAKESIGTIMISPGRTESRLSYYEIAMSFQAAGYNVSILEHKGQGKSFRYNREKDVGHIEAFGEYVENFSAFTNHVRDFVPGPYYLYASSMGAAIALMRAEVANSFVKIVLATPMFEIKTKGIPFSIVRPLLDIKEFFTTDADYAPFVGPFDPSRSFEDNEYAKSKTRFELNNELYQKHPDYRVGGPSIKWLRIAMGITDPLKVEISAVKTPVVIFQADDDRFVRAERQTTFCSWMKKCELRVLEGSFHALHLDSDKNVQRLIDESIAHFKGQK